MKMPKRIDMESTGLSRSDIMADKPKLKYVLFSIFSLSGIGACEVSKDPHIFITIGNQHIQEINRHFDWTLNHFGPMVCVENQKQN